MRVFSVLPAQTGIVLGCDLFLAALVFTGATALSDPHLVTTLIHHPFYWVRVLLAAGSVVGGLYFNELYIEIHLKSRVALGVQVGHVFGLSLLTQMLLAYVDPALALPREAVLFAMLAGIPAFFFWRVLYGEFIWKLFGQQKIVLVGNGRLAQELAREIADQPGAGLQVVGYVGTPVSPKLLPGVYLGPFDRLSGIVCDLKPDRVVVACSDQRSGGMPVGELVKLRQREIPIQHGADLYETLHQKLCSSEFPPNDFIFDDTLVHRASRMALQSIYTNLLALACLFLLSPVLLILAVSVKLAGRGPVLESVLCIGYRGIPFYWNRFRVTRVEPGGARLVLTGIGRFLRNTHLDLLPSLINLLRGEMAFVGPPANSTHVAEELSGRIPFYEQRFALRPGLTGWSQINADRKHRPPGALETLEYDLYYLKNMSLSLDAYILLRRFRRMLTFSPLAP